MNQMRRGPASKRGEEVATSISRLEGGLRSSLPDIRIPDHPSPSGLSRLDGQVDLEAEGKKGMVLTKVRHACPMSLDLLESSTIQ